MKERRSPNILYGGAVPNQLVMPAVHWALSNLGKKGDRNTRGRRIYLAGSDYILFPCGAYPHQRLAGCT